MADRRLKKIEAALKSFRKEGTAASFDALKAVAERRCAACAYKPERVIVIIGDGLDRGSKTSFEGSNNLQLGRDCLR